MTARSRSGRRALLALALLAFAAARAVAADGAEAGDEGALRVVGDPPGAANRAPQRALPLDVAPAAVIGDVTRTPEATPEVARAVSADLHFSLCGVVLVPGGAELP